LFDKRDVYPKNLMLPVLDKKVFRPYTQGMARKDFFSSLFSPPKLSMDAKKVPSPFGRRCHEVADEGYGIVSLENKIPHPALASATLSPQVPVSLKPASQEEKNHFGGLKSSFFSPSVCSFQTGLFGVVAILFILCQGRTALATPNAVTTLTATSDFNPNFAIGRGIRRRRPDIFFLRKFVHGTTRAFTFFVETVSASFVSVLTPIAKSGFKCPREKSVFYGFA